MLAFEGGTGICCEWIFYKTYFLVTLLKINSRIERVGRLICEIGRPIFYKESVFRMLLKIKQPIFLQEDEKDYLIENR